MLITPCNPQDPRVPPSRKRRLLTRLGNMRRQDAAEAAGNMDFTPRGHGERGDNFLNHDFLHHWRVRTPDVYLIRFLKDEARNYIKHFVDKCAETGTKETEKPLVVLTAC